MKLFVLEQYTSRNTSFRRIIWKRSFETAENYVLKLSKKYKYPLAIIDGKIWSKFEQGEKVEWSYGQ